MTVAPSMERASQSPDGASGSRFRSGQSWCPSVARAQTLSPSTPAAVGSHFQRVPLPGWPVAPPALRHLPSPAPTGSAWPTAHLPVPCRGAGGGCKYRDLSKSLLLFWNTGFRGSKAVIWQSPPQPRGSAEAARCPRGLPGSRPCSGDKGKVVPGLTPPRTAAAVGAPADNRACTVQDPAPGWGDSCGFWWLSVAARLRLG